jgi:hypothetical protein
MSCMTSGLVDHVHQDQAEVDRSNPKRRDGSELAERLTSGDRIPASIASR